jgi:hypothetical protein
VVGGGCRMIICEIRLNPRHRWSSPRTLADCASMEGGEAVNDKEIVTKHMEGGEAVNDKDIVHLWKVMSNKVYCQSIYGPTIGGTWV